MVRKFRLLSLLSVLVLVAMVAGACQAVHAEPARPARSLADIAEQVMGTRTTVVKADVGPSQATDPAQAQAEDEFLKVVLDRDSAFYAQDAERFFSYYADEVIALPPAMETVMGKAANMEGDQGFFDTTDIVGKFTVKRIWVSGNYATRWAEWEEVTMPKAGGEAEHHIGRCFVAWQKIDGQWKVVSQISNFIQEPQPVQ